MSSSSKKPVIVKHEGRTDKNKQRRGRRFQNARRNTVSDKFKGKTEELEGHIYNVGVANQSQLFASTTKEIGEYAGRN